MKVRTVTIELTEQDVAALGLEISAIDSLSVAEVLDMGCVVVDDMVEDEQWEQVH